MQKLNRLFNFCGILMLASESWKQWCLTYIIQDGVYDWWYFPFQLCSIPMYICLLLPHIKNASLYQALCTFLMDIGLLGGIFAFFDTSGMQYSYLPLSMHSVLWHLLLIFIGITVGRTIGVYAYLPWFYSICLYLLCCCTAAILNGLLSPFTLINMFYINPRYQMTQKIFYNLSLQFGNSSTIFLYIFTTITGSFLLHCVWRRIHVKTYQTK